jgi:hypothetical protein
MWAAYFIPMWLRRHEELSESRSVERFSQAMRILSRRPATPDQRYVVMPRRPEEEPPGRRRAGPLRWLPGRRSRPLAAGPRRPDRRPGERVARDRRAVSLAVRRRRILAGLLVTTLLGALLAPLTPLPWWLPVALLALTVADLAHLRVQARRARAVDRARDSVRRRTRSRLHRLESGERIRQVGRALAEERSAAELERRAAEQAAAEAAERAAAGWQPVPVPLPTYVTKPAAPAGRRGGPPIDLTRPGKWSDGRAAQAGRGPETPFDQTAVPDGPPAPRPPVEDVHPDELDVILERRRAVND